MNRKKKKTSADQIEIVPFIPGRVSKDKDEIVREIEKLHNEFLENARNHLLLAKQIGERLETNMENGKIG